MIHFHKWSKWKLVEGSIHIQVRRCTKCGKSQIDEGKHIHDWSEWKSIDFIVTYIWGARSDETRQVRKCKTCGFVETKRFV